MVSIRIRVSFINLASTVLLCFGWLLGGEQTALNNEGPKLLAKLREVLRDGKPLVPCGLKVRLLKKRVVGCFIYYPYLPIWIYIYILYMCMTRGSRVKLQKSGSGTFSPWTFSSIFRYVLSQDVDWFWGKSPCWNSGFSYGLHLSWRWLEMIWSFSCSMVGYEPSRILAEQIRRDRLASWDYSSNCWCEIVQHVNAFWTWRLNLGSPKNGAIEHKQFLGSINIYWYYSHKFHLIYYVWRCREAQSLFNDSFKAP